MAHLFDLLSAYPVAETLAQALPLASLVNLSKVNAEHRAILHGFPRPIATKDGEYESKIRPDLYICFHQTDYWRNLKIKQSATVLGAKAYQRSKPTRMQDVLNAGV